MSNALEGNFVHVVFFWLKNPESEADRNTFLQEINSYTHQIGVIKRLHIGTPADTSRPVIDSSYTFCLVTSFDSKADHDIYQDHPLHHQFIANASHLWEKVLVYDSEMI